MSFLRTKVRTVTTVDYQILLDADERFRFVKRFPRHECLAHAIEVGFVSNADDHMNNLIRVSGHRVLKSGQLSESIGAECFTTGNAPPELREILRRHNLTDAKEQLINPLGPNS